MVVNDRRRLRERQAASRGRMVILIPREPREDVILIPREPREDVILIPREARGRICFWSYRSDSKNSYDPTSFNFTVTGGSSHRSLISAENALNAASSVSGFPPSVD